MASAKRAKSTSRGKRVEAKQSRVLPAVSAPKAARLAKQATKAITKSVKSVADTAKKVATNAKKGVSKQAAAVAAQASLAKKSVAKKAKRVAKQAAAAKVSVTQQAKSVAKKAKATVVEKAGKAKQAARAKVGVVKESPVGDRRASRSSKEDVMRQLKQSSKSSAPDAGANGTVAVGSPAPSFSLPDQEGNLVTSESLKGAPYVLYFYPKDDTPGCTKEACGFRDSGAAFGKNGVRVLGVSPDSEKSHARFSEKYGLPFTLLADVDKKLAAAYGVWVEKTNYGRKYMGIERSTFLVDGKGRVQKIWRGVRVPGHVDDVLLASGTI